MHFVREEMMRLTFTKRDGKYDDLLIERPDAAPETIKNPKQGIIPHDMAPTGIWSTNSCARPLICATTNMAEISTIACGS